MCRSKAGQNRRAHLRLPIPRHDDGRGILLHDGMVLESPALLNRCSLPHSGRFFREPGRALSVEEGATPARLPNLYPKEKIKRNKIILHALLRSKSPWGETFTACEITYDQGPISSAPFFIDSPPDQTDWSRLVPGIFAQKTQLNDCNGPSRFVRLANFEKKRNTSRGLSPLPRTPPMHITGLR